MKKYSILIISLIMIIVTLVVFCGFWFVLYPLKYKNQILHYSNQYELDSVLVASLINVESGYGKNKVSSSGACGLMQLMPSTADEIAGKLGKNEYNIFDIDTNINMGCWYLRYLFEQLGDDVDTVLAGYNAGPNAVKALLNNNEYSKDGVTIDDTPYQETNDYIKRINNSYPVYKYRLKL